MYNQFKNTIKEIVWCLQSILSNIFSIVHGIIFDIFLKLISKKGAGKEVNVYIEKNSKRIDEIELCDY